MTVTRPALRLKDIAPHLAGRMLPGLFTYLGIGKVERFPGDPFAQQEPWAAWFWMHTTGCEGGLYRAKPIPLHLRIAGEPAQAGLFAGYAA
jgi:hypothetical protein